jgi:serine/threonine protein kinase/tetratricopeptide (TPR) repeat protein
MRHATPAPHTLAPGAIVAGRFTLQRQAGHGGMGFVYQALDAETGRIVALKLMYAAASSVVAQRFLREARLLSELHHPGIVSYVAHGLTDDDQPFLAMEWLEGEDVAQRLARQPLSPSETLKLVRRVAEGLAVAHQRSIIHRDIKPSNLFLRGGQPEDAVLLDFGLARFVAASQALTGSAMVLGTPGYMAPEQASHQDDITPSADIFSLGCVLYEGLTGKPPFQAPHLAAVLAKILFTEPPPLSAVHRDMPASLQRLVDRMLAKNPEQRIADARALLHVLGEMEALPDTPAPAPLRPSTPGLQIVEQQLVSVMLATPELPPPDDAPTLKADEAARVREQLEPLRLELESHGAKALVLADGSLLSTFLLERGTAADQAILAAHCALTVKERWPASRVVLTTGLSLKERPVPMGEVVDRAGEFLRRMEGPLEEVATQVLLDETTGGLLSHRFELERAQSGVFLLRGEHLSLDESRPLLGKPTSCVGREQELAILEMVFSTCVEDATARAVLVTAPVGTGKSRLRHEFLRRLERRGQPMLILLARGDPMHSRSAYGLLGQALRTLCGVVDGEPLEARREKLSRRTARYLLPQQMKDAVEFLGELCGVNFPDEDSPRLRAAREDPRLMGQQVAEAMVAFLRAELSQGPALLVLEDLHWCDAPSVKLVDEVLRQLSDSPVLVLALARPEVKDLYPELWSQCMQEVPLRGLSQKASTRLVQEVLGPQVPPAVVARLVEQAAGNALFLEELIRGVAEGRGGETPGTVLAMLQSRLQRMDPMPRRVLLAASIFGRSFWAGGVRSLLNEELSALELERWLRDMVALEIIQPQLASRFPAEAEYRFRHTMMRDAAYSLVPETLKPVGHHLAGEWLERVGEPDLLVLAEHYQLGHQKDRAVHFFTRAGERLFEQQDLLGAQRCLESALACEPSGDALSGIQALQAAISFWMEDFAQSYAVSSELLPLPATRSAQWTRMLGGLILACAQNGRQSTVAELAPRLLVLPERPEALAPFLEMACVLACMTTWYGQRYEAVAILERMETASAALPMRNGVTLGWMACARGYFDYFLDPAPWRCRVRAEEATRELQPTRVERGAATAQALWGLALAGLGDLPGALQALREGVSAARRAGQAHATAWLQLHLALVLSGSVEPAHQEEARQLALDVLKTEAVNLLHMGLAHLALAKAQAAVSGSLPEAEAQARRACELLGVFVPHQLVARVTLCATLMAQGRPAQAKEEAEAAVRLLERMGGCGAVSVGVYLALAEACFALGEEGVGSDVLYVALQCLRLRAEDVPEPARERFHQVPEHARVLELARQRLGEGESGPLA